MLGYRRKRKAFIAKALVMPVTAFIRRRLRMRLRRGGRQGGRHPHFALWLRPLDRLPRET